MLTLLLLCAAMPAGAAHAPHAVGRRAPAASQGGRVVAAAPITLTTSQVITDLAAEGIGVYTSASATAPVDPVTAPVVPIKVLESQAVLYADATVSHAGILGSALSALVPMPAPPAGSAALPFDYLLAAYATAGTTPGEVLAGQLLGTQNFDDPDDIAFPALVPLLFSADAVRAAEAGTSAAGTAAPATAGNAGLCATLADWVSQGFNSVFSLLTVSSSTTPVLNFLTSIWNSAVSLAKTAISDVVTALTTPVLGAIRTGLGVVGVASWAIGALGGLKVTTKATPAFNSFGVLPAAGNAGTLTITVGSPAGFTWPAAVSQCASTLGVTLPDLQTVVGTTVNWTMTQVNGVPPVDWCAGAATCNLATENTATTTTSLDAQHTASFGYTTNTESADQVARGKPITNDYVLVSATVSVNTAALQSLLDGMVLGNVPKAVRIVVGPMFDALTSSVMQQLAALAQPSQSRFIAIEHHQTPALLPNRTCEGLYDAADFPGTTQGGQPSNVDGGTICVFGNNDNQNPIVAADSLFVESSPSAAAALFQEASNALQSSSPVSGIGDEAVEGTGCSESTCGPAGIVRVANDVLSVSYVNTTPDLSTLLSSGVTELCPKCKFPTSPPA